MKARRNAKGQFYKSTAASFARKERELDAALLAVKSASEQIERMARKRKEEN